MGFLQRDNESQKSKVYVINGVHTAGKSTICDMLTKKGYTVFEEIAGKLIRENIETQIVSDGGESNDSFQRIILREEKKRIPYIERQNQPIIESFYVGNIPYCVTSAEQDITEEVKSELLKFLENNEIEAIFLEIDLNRIKERTQLYSDTPTEKLEEYNKRIKDETFRVYEEFKIKHHIVKNNGNINKTLQNVIDIIES